MDNLYENLENYEEENILDELKRENSNLKYKLEEYSVTIDKLQKDFNKLSSEFKNLERNYSSLLKTAKEEIERKTQIITKLNLEKDMMVINSIHNRTVTNLRRTRAKPKQENAQISTNDNIKKTTEEFLNTKETCVESERKDKNYVPSDTNYANTDVSKLRDKNVDKWTGQASDSKENITCAQKIDNLITNKSKALSIMNRRKSMPAIRNDIKFSSDDESEGDEHSTKPNRYNSLKHATRDETFNKGPQSVVYKNRVFEDLHRFSETSSVDDKSSNYRNSKEYRNKRHYSNTAKYTNRTQSDSYRYRNYGSFERIRRHRSPEQHQMRSEYNRKRGFESPPHERHHNYNRPRYESRPTYDHEAYYDRNKNRHEYDKNCPTKHKLLNDDERNDHEPLTKRKRNYSNTHNEENFCDSDRMPMQNPLPGAVENIVHGSCQSPDYIITDPNASQPIREIMNTAATQLEDPRLHSNKYILQQVNDITTSLTAISGKDVDLKKIENSKWKTKEMDMPKALRRRPSICSDDYVKDIYMDIENPVSNMSVESGEIVLYASDDERTFKSSLNRRRDPRQTPERSFIIEKPQVSNNQNNFDNSQPKTKYRIPKLKVKQVTDHKSQVKVTKRNSIEEAKSSVVAISNKDNSETLSNKKCSLSLKKSISNNNDVKKLIPLTSSIKTKESVEEDLHLSDETNDCIDSIKKNEMKNDSHESNNLIEGTHLTETHLMMLVKSDNSGGSNKKSVARSTTMCPEKEKVNEAKKQMSKNEHMDTDKKTRPKKDKTGGKEIKTTFCELFGDSSSLITPEDLGLNILQQSQPTAKYIPVCEDAQDAVDLKATSITKGLTQLPDINSDNALNVIGENVIKNTDNIQDNNVSTQPVSVNSKKTKKLKKDKNSTVTTNEYHEDSNISQPKIESQVVDNSTNLISIDTVSVSNHVNKEAQIQIIPKPNIMINALATSTPQKESKENLENEPISVVPEPNSNYNGNYDKITKVDSNRNVPEQSSNNDTLDSQTEIDAPDVRIFVKRRRRVLKKANA